MRVREEVEVVGRVHRVQNGFGGKYGQVDRDAVGVQAGRSVVVQHQVVEGRQGRIAGGHDVGVGGVGVDIVQQALEVGVVRDAVRPGDGGHVANRGVQGVGDDVPVGILGEVGLGQLIHGVSHRVQFAGVHAGHGQCKIIRVVGVPVLAVAIDEGVAQVEGRHGGIGDQIAHDGPQRRGRVPFLLLRGHDHLREILHLIVGLEGAHKAGGKVDQV